MKSQLLALILLSVLSLGLFGCGKSGSANIDVSPVEKSFSGADDTGKAAAAKVVDAVKNADYDAAMTELLKLTADPKLTDPQKKAVAQLLDQVTTALANAGKQAAGDAGKALGDAPKPLGK